MVVGLFERPHFDGLLVLHVGHKGAVGVGQLDLLVIALAFGVETEACVVDALEVEIDVSEGLKVHEDLQLAAQRHLYNNSESVSRQVRKVKPRVRHPR